MDQILVGAVLMEKRHSWKVSHVVEIVCDNSGSH